MIECVEMRGIKHDVLKGIAKVKIPSIGMVFSDVKLFHKNDKYWVSLPTKEYEKDGKKNYYQLIQFIEKEKGDKLLEEIKNCLVKELVVGKGVDEENRRQVDPPWDF
jgi:hypothetical protein